MVRTTFFFISAGHQKDIMPSKSDVIEKGGVCTSGKALESETQAKNKWSNFFYFSVYLQGKVSS